MRSPVSIACAFAVLWLAVSAPQTAAAQTEAASVQVDDVEAARAKLEADPNLSATRKTRAPRWRSEPDEEERDFSAFEWIGELFRWIAQGSRVFVWVVIALLIGALALYLFRFLRSLPEAQRRAEAPPTHVRDLDIRPESLPDDIGAAAWSAWERGDQRAALSLLYRGLLSRLVHVYAAPIRSSSTEGDCLVLARARLPTQSGEFAGRLIDVWQRAVYGAQPARADDVRTLCEAFSAMLAQTAPASEQPS